jgi:hypothetical protein
MLYVYGNAMTHLPKTIAKLKCMYTVLLCLSAFAGMTGQCHNYQLSLTYYALRACKMGQAKVQREKGVSFGFLTTHTLGISGDRFRT